MRIWLEQLLGHARGADNRTPLNEARFVVIDTELTSLDVKVNRVLSVGAIAMDGPRIRLAEQFYRVVNPGVEVPERTILVHGLRPADVANGEDPAAVMSELAKFLEGAVLVGHFIAIDIAALKKEFKGTGRRLGNVAVDSAKVHRWLELERRTFGEATDDRHEALDLPTVAKHYNVSVGDAHHALADAFVTAQLWQKLLHGMEAVGLRTVGELRRIG
jgi:DNA polymerase III epsilon subunit family exonuclease